MSLCLVWPAFTFLEYGVTKGDIFVSVETDFQQTILHAICHLMKDYNEPQAASELKVLKTKR
jgi:hypothetical protein